MVSASVSLRCASLKDAGDMSRLSQQLGYRVTLPEMQQRLGNLIQREEHLVEVATIGGSDRAVGWVHACRTDSFLLPPFAEIKVLVVEEGYRRCGIGSLLLQTVEARSRVWGCSTILLRSNVTRRAAHQFYEKVGYTKVKQAFVFSKSLPLECI